MSLNSPAILQRVASFIERNRLLNQPSSQPLVYVGLSGGPDSVALLHILRSLGYDCQALHCNFHLRGEESNRDQDFCESLCRQLQIEIIIEHFDTREYMKSHHLSLEMAARELRYQWWKKMMDEQGIKGKECTPFLLKTIVELTGGDSLESNIKLVLNNAAVGSEVAKEYAKL